MYITRAELIDRYGEAEITRLEVTINDADAVTTAINDACEKVNGYIAAYLPLTAVPTALKRAVAVIARYYLYKNKPSDNVRQDYEDELAWLDKIASGKVVLVVAQNTDNQVIFSSGAFVA